MNLHKLLQNPAVKAPKILPNNVMAAWICGSHAFGCNTEDSDIDIVGMYIPSLEDIFPHLSGFIPGFGTQKQLPKPFVAKVTNEKGEEMDCSIYGIVQYFDLVMGANPNVFNTLYIPSNNYVVMTAIGQHMVANRRVFLSRKIFKTHIGYATGQLRKMDSNKLDPDSKRAALRERYGFDTKFAYNLIRAMKECEQYLLTGEVDLQKDKEIYKAIRQGEWTQDQVRKYFNDHDPFLQKLEAESKLPYEPNEAGIKKLMLECIEMHYGSIDKYISQPEKAELTLEQIRNLLR